MITDFTPENLNKSQIERDNIQRIMDSMSLQERTMCYQMISKLQLTLADPKYGQTFMMALAFANADMACMLIEAGIVNATGDGPGELIPFKKASESE